MSDDVSRRSVLMSLGVLLNGAVAAILAVPIIGYLLAPVRRKSSKAYSSWIALGALSEFPEGQTRLATFHNPFVRPWDGQTADIPCYVRRLAGEDFQVFAINWTTRKGQRRASPEYRFSRTSEACSLVGR